MFLHLCVVVFLSLNIIHVIIFPPLLLYNNNYFILNNIFCDHPMFISIIFLVITIFYILFICPNDFATVVGVCFRVCLCAVRQLW